VSELDTSSARAQWLARLDAVEERLASLGLGDPGIGMTEPDPGAAERWSQVEVWAHLGEFPDYWLDQLVLVIRGQQVGAVPFGRTKADPARRAAVASARRDDLGRYLRDVLGACNRLRALLSTMYDGDWAAKGVHPTLGEMDVAAILDEFLIGHLEEHAAQLEALNG
jgi:hypothetical protein